MKKITFLIFMILLSCSKEEEKRNVGDISFDKNIDDVGFKVCDEKRIKQYYVRYSSDTAPSYKGEKRNLINTILSNYNFQKSENENGYLTIRFIVNCKGKTGRFRIEEMDFDYKSKKFDSKIKNQLLAIVKNLDGWIPRKKNNQNLDYYQYLTFKIENGQIIKILP